MPLQTYSHEAEGGTGTAGSYLEGEVQSEGGLVRACWRTTTWVSSRGYCTLDTYWMCAVAYHRSVCALSGAEPVIRA